MKSVMPLAVITFKEGIRNRAVYGIAILAILLYLISFAVVGMVPRSIGKAAVDMALSVVSLSGLLVVLFVGINLMVKDLDRRTIYMVLSRPISRTQYVVGKFLGVTFLLCFTYIVVGFLSYIMLFLVKLTYPLYFDRVSFELVFIAILYSLLGFILLEAVSFLFSSFTTSSYVTLVLTLIVYLIGQSLRDVRQLVLNPEAAGIQVSALTAKVVQFAYYALPNLSFFDLKLQAAHSVVISADYLFWTAVYGATYICIVLTVASLLFRRREFP